MALLFIICSTVMYTFHMEILYLKLNTVCFKLITSKMLLLHYFFGEYLFLQWYTVVLIQQTERLGF